jgi:aminoglycoside phosphotransferase (APT) family kinase protein
VDAVIDPRIYPLIDVSRDELERLVGGRIVRAQPIHGGLRNTLHRVIRGDGAVFVVKHHAEGRDAFERELATLERLARILPVPEVVRFDRERLALVYHWIFGETLDNCRRDEPPVAFTSLAEPLGRLFAWLAHIPPLEDRPGWSTGPAVEFARTQLTGSTRARERMGTPLATALLAALDGADAKLAWGTPCVGHHDIGGRNVLVQRADGDRWRISGVIDWELAGIASPLGDLGSFFRYAPRFDSAFLADFERGYREADGALPDDWFRTARLLDALRLIDTLDGVRELPGVYSECKSILTKLVVDLGHG